MKALFFIGVLVLGLASCATNQIIPEQPIVFKDPVLESRIKAATQLEVITPSTARTITHLKLGSTVDTPVEMRIKDISGLEHFIALEELNLQLNNISDISPLRTMKSLRFLDLWVNNVVDISVLSELHLLQEINLGHNAQLRDIEPLKQLPQIRSLWLNFCGRIHNLYMLADFASASRIEVLGLAYCNVRRIQFLQNMTSLQDLMIQSNKELESLEPLKNLSQLRTLYANSCSIKDFTILDILFYNGCFSKPTRFKDSIDISNNNTNVSPGTPNRDTIERFLDRNIKISWEQGNIVSRPSELDSPIKLR